MSLGIDFFPISELAQEYVPAPKSAKYYIPSWYKNFGKQEEDTPISQLKKCVPFIDSLTHGYIQETWSDIIVERDKENNLIIIDDSNPKMIKRRSEVSPKIYDTFYPIEFIWQLQWKPILPDGWSVMLTHPLNRLDLPFSTLTGIIDADTYSHGTTANFPFYINDNFKGIIPAGTPMYQMILIKRSDWKSNILKYNKQEIDKKLNEVKNHFPGAYRKLFWQKKKFE